LQDRCVTFFAAELPVGKHTLRYALLPFLPGKFTALPPQVANLYSPELWARGQADQLQFTEP
ncbi:MAG: hypothetical protein HY692_04700, partial [Cyanobacteria bacterium NC_groundwater_1444_Ag_S-0.65um_54_12]|nr:hypothetical protein [Cyanobacteria bacterium NC_groundwater_1444_Ag_S-0.65um_54_12]